ncbi:MAG: ADOP family duplicated permease [Gemmatimonadetes bacterium]|nr:ADOP family duplicated permease [Gemmatimonadota bacterium]
MTSSLLTAFRSLRRSPGFALLVIGTLAVGIGGAAAIFSLVNTLLLKPLPFPAEEQLVRMRDEVARPGEDPWRYNSSARSYVALRERSGIFQGVIAQRYRPMVLTAPGEPVRVIGIGVSSGWTEVLGVAPVLGRPFNADESGLGPASGVVLLGDDLWRSRFEADPDVVGRAVVLDGTSYTVVGVMPRAYNYPYGADLWIPDRFDADDTAFGPYVVGRLRPGASIQRAQVELDGVSAALAEEHPESHASIRLLAVPFRDDLVSNHPRVGLALLLGSGILLLLACFNIANLQLVRGAGRQPELAVRAALGAGVRRQVGQLFMESVLLAAVGSAAGLLLAVGLHGVMARLGVEADASLGAFFTDLRLDWRVAAFALALGTGTALLSGVFPALRVGRVDPARVLTGAGRGSGGRGRGPLDAMVAGELAVAVVLLSAAALMVGNTTALRSGDPGYDVADRLTFRVGLSSGRAPTDSARVIYLAALLGRLAEEPGIVAVGASHHLPLDDGSSTTAYSIDGGPATEGDRRLIANIRIVAGDYFTAMGVPVERGRAFEAEEHRVARDVAIVNRAFAERYWDGDAVGRRLRLGPVDGDRPWLTVVGVLATVDENIEARESIYIPYSQSPTREVAVVAMAPGIAAGSLRRAVHSVDPAQPLDGLTTMTSRREESLAAQTAATRLMIGFATFGLALAALGIYGVLAFMVRRRRHELAVRRALGLTGAGAFGRIIRRCIGLTVAGIAAGIPAAVLFNDLLSRVLGGATRNVSLDVRLMAEHARLPASGYALIAAGLLVLAIGAASVPGFRAAAVHPARVLRGE